ncbi:MAG: agmatinase [Candidatus Diapherotrites archaeon]
MNLREKIAKGLGEGECFSGLNFSEKESKVIIYGAPLEETVSFKKGTAKGPEAIREASKYLETFVLGAGREYFENAKTCDLGDLAVSGSVEEVIERIREMNEAIKAEKKVPFLLGGEHTVSVGAAKAFAAEKPVVVHFDAHADLKEEFHGEKLCHATAAKRILDFVPEKNLLQLGIRSVSKKEFEFIKKKKIKTVWAEKVKESPAKTAKAVSKFTAGKKVYLSLDIDVLDAPLVPGTGTPEPGGLSYGELMTLVGAVKGKVIGLDLVETAPDEQKITETTAANIVYECLARLKF